ncbi:ATP-binding protein [Streptomyces specialis]|uniref:ATP-binding protein n=1 Tax=Streptomyces specialis TaxID=498367 RepID=UPI00073E9944|nr:NB-ARC domain-containing protein [Streptomyces specialis]
MTPASPADPDPAGDEHDDTTPHRLDTPPAAAGDGPVVEVHGSSGIAFQLGGSHNTQHIHQPAPPPPIPRGSDLPRDIAEFTGRHDELQRLVETAQAGRTPLITIHTVDGMPGVGKTALATRAAHLLTDRYPDGHRFVRLNTHTTTPAQPATVLAELLRSLGIDPRNIPDSIDERASMWRDRLAGRRMLLVLDDAATAAQVEPLIPANRECLVIITSRRRLLDLDGARPLPLAPMPPDQAAELFVRLSRRTPTPGDQPAIDKAVDLCGHLPLAITILAARLAVQAAWTITEFVDEVAASQDRLGELEAGDRAVNTAFDFSYHHLGPDLQRLYRRLGLHPGPDTDPYATAALDNIPHDLARRRLRELHTLHLIDEPAPRRYRLHDLLRHYAHIHTHHDPPHERDQALTRLLDYYTHTAQQADHHLTHTPLHISRCRPRPGQHPGRPGFGAAADG